VRRAISVAPVVELLLSRCKTLSSNSNTSRKRERERERERKEKTKIKPESDNHNGAHLRSELGLADVETGVRNAQEQGPNRPLPEYYTEVKTELDTMERFMKSGLDTLAHTCLFTLSVIYCILVCKLSSYHPAQ
jgi:hypothetical protein